MGTGTVKAVVNVFGARQYHPVLQRSMVESYYVRFYMVINVGAVAGCIVVPVVARSSITAAYTIPFVLLLVAVLFFVAGSKRYVNVAPGRNSVSSQRTPDNNGTVTVDEEIDSAITDDEEKPNFADVAKLLALIIPFNIVYVQGPTTCKDTFCFVLNII